MEQITTKELDKIQRILGKSLADNDGFLGGNLGLAFYYFNLYRVTEDIEWQQKGMALIEKVFEGLNSGEPRLVGPAFSNGGGGLAYLVNELVNNHLLDFDIATEFEDLDSYLFNMASAGIDDDFNDCLHGAFGIIHSFSGRAVGSKGNEYMDILIEKVCSKAVRNSNGLWFRNYVMQSDEKKETNFGLSHGLSGMLLILIECYPSSSHKTVIAETVKQGCRFILKHLMDIDFSRDEYSLFPFWVDTEASEIINKSRMGWCYGDLNQSLLFYRAGKLLDDDELTRMAHLTGLNSLMRKGEAATRISDAHFCHGSAGVAQFYKALYKESGIEKYLDGYEYWIEQTLIFLEKDLKEDLYKGKEHSLLDGLTGIAFVLLEYISNKPLNWSKALFL